MANKLQEFFQHALREGPTDPAFAAAPEVKPAPGAEGEADAALLEPTQDVAKASATSLDFFSKNVSSVTSKAQLEGFDPSGLDSFARSLDAYAFQCYGRVQDPSARQAFEADYQKIAADASKDWAKLLEKVKGLSSHEEA